jgi:hypothetical protein
MMIDSLRTSGHVAKKTKAKAAKRPTKKTPKRAKRAKKKTSRPSTTRSTAGPGFDFEDRVAAWLLVKELTGQPLPGVDGAAARLQMQVEALGWHIDDILLTAMVSANDPRQLAISCKSNVQVTASGLPPDFTARCWQQWSKPDPNPMRRGKDCLALVTRGSNSAFMATWSELKNAAPDDDIELALGRMRASAKHRAMFESVKAPAKDVGVTVSDADVVAMINTIAVVPLDFHIADSDDEKQAVALSCTLLVNGSLGEGKRLWGELIAYARNTRLGSGTLDISHLWRLLRGAFGLKDHPDYEASWQRLRALTHDYKAAIETALSTGLMIDRQSEIDELMATISTDTECVVFGESGCGKSALVKAMLDERFPNVAQVWFGPDTLEPALSEAGREGLGIRQPLGDVLKATSHVENFLVIDASEKLNRACTVKAKALIARLRSGNVPAAAPIWRVLIVAQTDAWVSGTAQELTGTATPKNFVVKAAPDGAVRQVLRAVAGLEWLAQQEDAMAALINLRALAWVIRAAARFQEGGSALSLTAIADRLWTHWTDSKPSVHRLLVRLAEREAAFEHSFAQSEFESGDAAVLDNLPIACPLRKDEASGRIQFEHDLAADWARFQRLKEIAGDTAQWAPLAGNPFWHSALRMLGQFLLRQPAGQRTAWDDAFESAEKNREAVPLADEVLLDALFLDPNAEAFLEARADMLFENGGARLLRLVKRFDHVASVAGVNAETLGRFRNISLYLEAQFRTPIIGRWPAMARFLDRHRARVAKMASPAIATLCDRWLTSTPLELASGIATPYRREFSELALAGAREMQLTHAKRIMCLGDGEMRLYQAAFAGAPDLPADVSEWALEMARRRPERADIVGQVRAYRVEQAKEHKERLESDAEYRKRHERRKNLPTPIGFSGRKLPPWPLGATGRVEGHFRDAVLRSAGFQALMRTVPAKAGEVLLACIVEDEPEEEYGSSRGPDRELGIEFDNEGYPTAPWKSPFYAFLQINANAALGFLHQLIDFATGRWVLYARGKRYTASPTLSVRLSDGAIREYAGNYWVFTWSHEDSLFIGQLHCALAALERWLCDLVDAGADIGPHIDSLLRATTSVAVLGVLVNVGKHKPELFKGPLRPLLGVLEMYEWDDDRARGHAHSFDAGAWARQGEFVFEMAKTWGLAPYRQKKLRDIVPEFILADRELAEFVLACSNQWIAPVTEKERLQFKILLAELDFRNYTAGVDPAGSERFQLTYPADVAAEIATFQGDNARLVQAMSFPQQCRKFLSGTRMLGADEAERVASLMAAVDGDEKVDVDNEMRQAPCVASAAVLLMRAQDWLAGHTGIAQRARSIVDTAIAGISDDGRDIGPRILAAPSHLEFAAYFAAERWIVEPSKENDERVLRLLMSGDGPAMQVLIGMGYRSRDMLGARWWRLLYYALLWSGLTTLRPRFGDDDEIEPARWRRWRRWLRTRSLSSGQATVDSIQPLLVAQRTERFELRRWQRRYARDGRTFELEDGRRLSGSLDTHFLHQAFGWLFLRQAGQIIPPEQSAVRRKLVAAFWAHQAWWQQGSGKDDNDDYQPMHEFGYALLDELARLIMESTAAVGPELWRPVFALGPKGHYAVGHFLTSWFALITEDTSVAEFAERWRAMIEFMVLNDAWAKGGPWYYGQRLERHVLGFGESGHLVRAKDCAGLIGSMRDLYEAWAKKRLTSDEDNLAGFCGFLGSEAGKPLRLYGLRWIYDAMKADPETGKWFRDRASNAFMEFLDVLVSEHATELSKDAGARQAMLDLVAHAVSRQLTAAQALQERIVRLF